MGGCWLTSTLQVGWIFIDLEVMDSDSSKYVCSRNKDTYFLRGNEAVLAAHLQNMHPNACRECDDGEFGSKFVTVVVTGNDQHELAYVAYQVSWFLYIHVAYQVGGFLSTLSVGFLSTLCEALCPGTGTFPSVRHSLPTLALS